jgi:ankyrin repeat protein
MAEELTDEALEFAEKMFTLAREGHTEHLAAYIDAGLPVDLANHNGDTLLILAAYHEHPDTVRALLQRGADVTRTNLRGQNALTSATFKQDVESVRALLAAGADPDTGTPSARATAAYFDVPAIAKLFG